MRFILFVLLFINLAKSTIGQIQGIWILKEPSQDEAILADSDTITLKKSADNYGMNNFVDQTAWRINDSLIVIEEMDRFFGRDTSLILIYEYEIDADFLTLKQFSSNTKEKINSIIVYQLIEISKESLKMVLIENQD